MRGLFGRIGLCLRRLRYIGFSFAMRHVLRTPLAELERQDPPFDSAPARLPRVVRWVTPALVGTVECREYVDATASPELARAARRPVSVRADQILRDLRPAAPAIDADPSNPRSSSSVRAGLTRYGPTANSLSGGRRSRAARSAARRHRLSAGSRTLTPLPPWSP
ncbi:hypothetical protein [Nocardia sp. bgisy118]|uniref:ATP dependent DNA ligase n=1 Tax=Nocardia sp. bgisy118 TaxID=3413786 RepID=UPI003F4A0B9B